MDDPLPESAVDKVGRRAAFWALDLPSRQRCGAKPYAVCLLIGIGIVILSLAARATESEPSLMEIAALQDRVSQGRRAIESFRIEGVVCALVSERNLIALQDASATILIEVPRLDARIQVEDRVAVVGHHCAIDVDRFEGHLGTMPTVDLDGRHPAITQSGRVYLRSGYQPIRLSWFNAENESALKLEYERSGLPRQAIPSAALWRKGTGEAGEFEPGLDFAAYTGTKLISIADFERLTPVARGVAKNFDRKYSVRAEEAGLVFTGYFEAPEAGVYTFHLQSDDGSRLYAGDPEAACEVIALDGRSAPTAMTLEEALAARNHSQWIDAEGTVIFAAADAGNLEIELDWRGQRLHATVLGGAAFLSGEIVQRRVRIAGLCEASRNSPLQAVRLTIPSASEIELEGKPIRTQEIPAGAMLRTAKQVRDLGHEEAERRLPVALQGVVTYAITGVVMLQDTSGGTFVLTGFRPERPAIGDLWEVEGCTEGGGFAPIVRAAKMRFVAHASLPEPIRATWDELMNGSLDEQYVEIEGVLTAAIDTDLTILTHGGSVKIRDHVNYPLPRWLTPASRAAPYVGSVLRIRGALSVPANGQTRQVVAGVVRLGSALASVEEQRPVDPFSIPTKKAADLRRFDAQASVFQRTKLAGQIICVRPGKAFMLEGKTGIRLLAKDMPKVRAGDLVEAVGFPEFGGPSPALQEAQVRITGRADLPAPVSLTEKELLDRRRDATLVRVEATLLGDTVIRGERVLELQAGRSHFLGRIEAGLGPMQALRAGSELQLVGVYAWGTAENRDAGPPEGFELWLGDPAGVTVLRPAPWWTERRIYAAAGTLTGALGLAAVWIALLRRKVEQRTAQWQKEVEQRQRAEQRRAVEQERIRVAQDLHDELGAGLTRVGLLGELAKSPALSAESKETYLGQLMEASRSLVTGLDEIVWAVNPQYDSVSSLANYYVLFAQRLLNLAGIACRFEVVGALPEHPLDSRVRHGVFLAFKEALNNIVRHSEATEVRLRIYIACDRLMLLITDNGCGFASQGATGGDGLANMRQRMLALGGECEIGSAEGHGTKVELSLPIENPRP